MAQPNTPAVCLQPLGSDVKYVFFKVSLCAEAVLERYCHSSYSLEILLLLSEFFSFLTKRMIFFVLSGNVGTQPFLNVCVSRVQCG